MKNTFDRGDTVFITCEHKTYDFATDIWSLANPDATFPKITIIDPKGVTKIPVDPEAPATMDSDETGKFYYLYEILATAERGWWRGSIQVENGGYPDKQPFGFRV